MKKRKSFGTSAKVPPVNLGITVGSLETNSFIIVEATKSHSYNDSHFEYEIIPITNYYTVWNPTLLNGLKILEHGKAVNKKGGLFSRLVKLK